MTPRLKLLLAQADPSLPLWDVGCDHGYLGEAALRAGFPFVHFVDPAEALIERLRRRLSFHFRSAGFHAERAQDLRESMHGNIVMAGFGADQMCEILDRHFGGVGARSLDRSRLILVPHKDIKKIPTWLSAAPQSWTVREFTITERRRTRTVFVADLVS